VDSGGAGLICIFEGMQMGLTGEWIDEDAEPIATYNSSLFTEYDPDSLLEYGYCTEFILQVQPSKVDPSTLKVQDIIEQLSAFGDSIVAVLEQTILKVHIHSFEPERVLAFARTMGEFLTIKIENMSVQHSETVAPKKDPVKYAVVATASGDGIIDYFKQIGAAAVIDGGQTNNPSAQDFIHAFETLDAEHIIVLPNDSNIVMAANQAAQMYDKTDVRVIPTKSIAEGYSALSMMDLSYDTVEAVMENMSAYLPDVTTGYVTTATRDAEIDGVAIRKGHFLGLTPKHIYCDGKDKVDVAMALFAAIPEMADKQVMTVFAGKDVTPTEQDRLAAAFEEAYPLIEVGFIEGNQDVYSFIFAIE
jgi:DAK2 domain fusion protein YloV